jgi:large subunit ribosomal protein L28
MAYKCDYCHKGIGYGHMVSHAKNRLARIFKPNLQKLKVLRNGITVRVKFCTHCIKRLKKDKKMGPFSLRKFAPKVEKEVPMNIPVPKKEEKKEKKVKKVTKAAETLKIEAIVGKKS